MISSPFTAIIIHYVALALSPPYALFGALYYIDRVSSAWLCDDDDVYDDGDDVDDDDDDDNNDINNDDDGGDDCVNG